MAHDTVTGYLKAWNTTDPAERDELLAGVVADHVRYVAPLADVTGRGAFSALIGSAQQQFPGMTFELLDERVDAHHDVLRFTWTLAPAGAEPIVIGTDAVLLAVDGRFALVTGYLDKVPG